MWQFLFLHFGDLVPGNQLNIFRLLITNQVFRKYAEMMSKISRKYMKGVSQREECLVQSSSEEELELEETSASFFEDVFSKSGKPSFQKIEAKLRIYVIKWMKKWYFERFLFGGNSFWNQTEIIFNYEKELRDLRFSSFFNVVVKLFLENIKLQSDSEQMGEAKAQRKGSLYKRKNNSVQIKKSTFDEDCHSKNRQFMRQSHQGLRSKYSLYKIKVNPKLFEKKISELFLLSCAKDFLLIEASEQKEQMSTLPNSFYFFDYLSPFLTKELEYYSERVFSKEEIPMVVFLGEEEFAFVFDLFVEKLCLTKDQVRLISRGLNQRRRTRK
jgi:hypothetical protein